jgi:predicted dehydrogenase
MINVGVLGCGYWGPNLIRNFMEVQNHRLKTVCDLRQERLDFIKSRYPAVEVTQNYRDILNDADIQAVAIATPVSTHYQFAKEALENGKHVMVEKPFTANVAQGEELIYLAQKKGKIVLVDHTFIYTGAVRKMKEIIDTGQLGTLYYFDSVRINLGLFQHDINVIWDLAPHDISIMDYLLNQDPVSVSATGVSHLDNGLEDIAYLTVNFDKNIIAHFHVNWLAPTKIRLIQIGGSEKMLVYDDMENSEKIKLYDKGIIVDENNEDGIYKALVQYRSGDMYAPKLDQTEALKLECEHFLDCIQNGKKPLTDGVAGLRVVKILENAEKSIKNNGENIRL